MVQSAGAYGMESPRLVWIPTGTPSANLRYLVTHETAHQWFYGLVGNDQARQPFADEAAADAVARTILGMHRSSRCSTARLDLLDLRLRRRLLLRGHLHPGREPARHGPRPDGHDRVVGGAQGVRRGEPVRASTTRTLLDALDAATPLDLQPTFRARFPSLY